jgi:transposase-like protein
VIEPLQSSSTQITVLAFVLVGVVSVNIPYRHLSIDTRLLVMTSAASKLQAQLSELNELRERLRKAELVWRSRRVDRRKKNAHSAT